MEYRNAKQRGSAVALDGAGGRLRWTGAQLRASRQRLSGMDNDRRLSRMMIVLRNRVHGVFGVGAFLVDTLHRAVADGAAIVPGYFRTHRDRLERSFFVAGMMPFLVGFASPQSHVREHMPCPFTFWPPFERHCNATRAPNESARGSANGDVISSPRTRANGVSLCACRRFGLVTSQATKRCTSNASAISERWQRHGTASAHIRATGRFVPTR